MTGNKIPMRSSIFAAIGSMLLLGAIASPASARWGDRDERDGHREYRHDWNGGNYRAPPVVYGGYNGYVPPPLVYGPSIGVYLPGVNVNIR